MISPYCSSLTTYQRRQTIEVTVGNLGIGSMHPIRVQSMTTTPTLDTQGTIEQSIRMIDAGCELVRITAPSIKEAKNLEDIRKGLELRGYTTPLVADIHYTPNAAEVAARVVQKVRINPGNYVDKKFFHSIEYTDAEYQAEIDRIRAKFVPLISICKEYGTAMRIGTNHGSLSDRIMSRYGDSPHGMVESALEFLRIAHDENYNNIVLSMKSSNALVMVQAYRLLVSRLTEEGLPQYPLHLGVTEAGDGEDGRVKSALGIGTLLEDGLGDTIRVSLTEEPEAEIPVAAALAERYEKLHSVNSQQENIPEHWNPYTYHQRATKAVTIIGGEHVPRVFADLRGESINAMEDLAAYGHHYDALTDKWTMSDQAAEFLFCSSPLPFMPPSGTRQSIPYAQWLHFTDKLYCVPHYSFEEFVQRSEQHSVMNIVCITDVISDAQLQQLAIEPTVVLVLGTTSSKPYTTLRNFFFRLLELQIQTPVVVHSAVSHVLYSATDIGGLLLDGFGNGVMLSPTSLAYGILQAARTRMTKTEYISCPSCGRTLFDLQETTANIREVTDHLKGVKIGIMGCIVNGPGEMADADYGYVGSGPDKITLYRGQEIIKRAVPTAEAVDQLIEIIKEDGRWVERQQPVG